METLLGHLAKFGSFSNQGEVLCTGGLAYLLKNYAEARSELASELAARAGIKVSDDLSWVSEARQDDTGRPDLEARTSDKTPIIKVEAKLDALFNATQFRSYVSDLQTRLQGRRLEGLLLVLVPRARTNNATGVVKGEFGLDGAGPWRARDYPDVAIAVISWDDVLTALGRVQHQGFRGELAQFEGMYRELSSYEIWPLAGPEELVKWRDRERDFVKLVDQVTKRLTTQHGLYPMAIEPIEQDPKELEPRGYNRRYVCQPLRGVQSCFSIGASDPFEVRDPATPIWMRFHRKTGSFLDIRERIESSHLGRKRVTSAGHIWIPLYVPLDADSEQMVNALVAQANEVLKIAYAPMPG